MSAFKGNVCLFYLSFLLKKAFKLRLLIYLVQLKHRPALGLRVQVYHQYNFIPLLFPFYLTILVMPSGCYLGDADIVSTHR